MRVQVLYFGVLKELLKRDGEPVELPAHASVGSLIEAICRDASAKSDVWRSLAVAVNQEYARTDKALQDGDEVALLPPVSGGGA